MIQVCRRPLHQRHKPSARPQRSAFVKRRQDNLRVGNGDCSPGGHDARHGRQVSWLAGRGTVCQRAFLAFPELFRNTKRRTIRRKRGVQPGLFVSPLQWLFPPASTSGRPHHAIRRHRSPQAGWKTLAAIQSRGRLRSACPAWVQAFAFPFALRAACLPSENHPREGLGPRLEQVNHADGTGRSNSADRPHGPATYGFGVRQSVATVGSQPPPRRTVPLAPCSTVVPGFGADTGRAGWSG